MPSTNNENKLEPGETFILLVISAEEPELLSIEGTRAGANQSNLPVRLEWELKLLQFCDRFYSQ